MHVPVGHCLHILDELMRVVGYSISVSHQAEGHAHCSGVAEQSLQSTHHNH